MRTRALLARFALPAVGIATAWPGIARACAVCFGDGDSDWTAAFLFGTMIMLVLPPAILGFAGYTIYKATKRQEARQAAASAAATK